MQQLAPPDLEQLSKLFFHDFVAHEPRDLLGKLLEKTIFLQVTEDAKLCEQMLRMKQQAISKRCPTLFSPLESQFFLAMSLIENAGRESDPLRQDEMVQKAVDILSVDPDRISMERIVPSLARIKKFSQIVTVCLLKVRQAMRCSERAPEIQSLLDVIVQVVEALQRSITESRIDGGQDEEFARALRHTRLDIKLALRDSIVNTLAGSDVAEAICHLLRAFLVKNYEVDFICLHMAPEAVAHQSRVFLQEQSKRERLTRKQFDSVVRLLVKSRRSAELAEVVKELLLDQVLLMDELEGAAAVEPELVRCHLSCEERIRLTRQTLQLMSDCQSQATVDRSAAAGGLGGTTESSLQLRQELERLLVQLNAQASTLKSLEAKVSLMESFARQSHADDLDKQAAAQRTKQKLPALGFFRKEL